MITCKDILLDNKKELRTNCEEVSFPLTNEDKELLKEMRQYIINSLDEELCEKYDLIPAVGIAAPQVGVTKRMCCVYIEMEDDDDIDLTLINPRIIAYSNENVYIENGEACLSVKDKHEGIVHRHAYIKVEYFDIDGNKQVIEETDFPAIAIQHEIDHLNGILFYDHINKLNPFQPKPNSYPL